MRWLVIVLIAGLAFMSCKNSQASDLRKNVKPENEAASPKPIEFTPASASEYLIKIVGRENIWRGDKDTLRLSLSRLIDHFTEPFDSARKRLLQYPFLDVEISEAEVIHSDTIPLLWLKASEFIVDTVALSKDPFITKKTIVMRTLEVDTSLFLINNGIVDIKALIDSLVQVKDTITETVIDYQYLEKKKIQVHRIENNRVIPPLLPAESRKLISFTADSSRLVIYSATDVWMGDAGSPFNIVPDPNMPDSLKVAVETLLAYTYERDSILLYLQDITGRKTPFWLSTGKEELYRYWVKNIEMDSITIWIGNPSKFDIKMILEEDVSVERMEKILAYDIPITRAQPERVLAKLKPLAEIPVFWNYSLISSFSLNQNYLANWSRGGQSSLSGMFDLRSEAVYRNTENKITWTNNGRLRYGTIRTKEHGYRTSADILELNSQFNKVITNKLDFSSVFYGKTQVAKGYKFPNDSVAISKFLNPGTFTIGAGVEYKPFKETLINFSALSYKNTFVIDTANINQTTHGIEAGKRVKHEMGGQLVIRNKVSVFDGMNISNTVRLFSNYLDKPKNIDVDWEMNIERQINWFFTIRLNLHLIYDDDIRFPVFDSENNPVLLPDGSRKKVAKTQFNQFLGLTMSFRI